MKYKTVEYQKPAAALVNPQEGDATLHMKRCLKSFKCSLVIFFINSNDKNCNLSLKLLRWLLLTEQENIIWDKNILNYFYGNI
jgi:hypothetical protein